MSYASCGGPTCLSSRPSRVEVVGRCACVPGSRPFEAAAQRAEMPSYRRFHVPGAAVFFTVVTHQRRRFLTGPLARRCLRAAVVAVRAECPFETAAMVLLPDHLHALWVLPPGDAAYARRWRRIKGEFTGRYLAEGGEEGPRSDSRLHRRERGLWQRRFWEHTIRDEEDFEQHCHYIHYNPVKHGLVRCPRDWPYSSFHRWVRRRAYPRDWGCGTSGPVAFDFLNVDEME